jgi:glycerophosphoryl diester phosphodiesterase
MSAISPVSAHRLPPAQDPQNTPLQPRRGSALVLGEAKGEPAPQSGFDEAFLSWSIAPTGIGVLDVILDVLFKLVCSPALLVIGLLDSFGAGIMDGIHNGLLMLTVSYDTKKHLLQTLRHKPDAVMELLVQRLARGGKLDDFFQGRDETFRRELLALLLTKVREPRTLALIAVNCGCEFGLAQASKKALAAGVLGAFRGYVRALLPNDPSRDAAIVRAAREVKLPLVIGHRGLPTAQPENTLPSLKAAIAAGANGVEIDLCVTKDGQVVLWHDDDPDSIVAKIRQAGMEPGQAYKPVVPPPGFATHLPVHELTYAAFADSHSYEATRSGVPDASTVEKPLLRDVAQWVMREPRCERIYFDSKLPEDASDELVERYARGVRAALKGTGIEQRVVLMTPYKGVLERLKKALPEYAATLDVEIVSLSPDPDEVSGLREGMAMGNGFVSLGHPRIGIDGREVYGEVMQRHAQRAERPRFIAWTLNTDREVEDAVASGIVDEVLTDRPAETLALLKGRLAQAQQQVLPQPVRLNVPVPVLDPSFILAP